MSQILDELREAINTGPKSRYRLWQETGVEQAQLSRFVNGTSGLGIESIEKLAEALGYEIVMKPRKKVNRGCDRKRSKR